MYTAGFAQAVCQQTQGTARDGSYFGAVAVIQQPADDRVIRHQLNRAEPVGGVVGHGKIEHLLIFGQRVKALLAAEGIPIKRMFRQRCRLCLRGELASSRLFPHRVFGCVIKRSAHSDPVAAVFLALVQQFIRSRNQLPVGFAFAVQGRACGKRDL